MSFSSSITSSIGPSITSSIGVSEMPAIFSVALQSSLVPEIATGSPTPTYTRATTATVQAFSAADNSGASPLILTVASGEARFKGARRISEGVWSKFFADGAPINTANTTDATQAVDALGPFGYMSEAAATNICLQSNNFSVTWGNFQSVDTQNQGIFIDGTNTFNKITDNSGGGTGVCNISQVVAVTGSVGMTLSVYAKVDQLTFCYLETQSYDSGANGVSYFDLSTGVVGTKASQHSASTIEALPNGIYRCSITFQTVTDLAGTLRVGVATVDNSLTVDLDGTSSILAGGAQLEVGSFPTLWIDTTTTPVTRDSEINAYPASGNLVANNGTIALDWTPEAASMGTIFIWGTYVDASNYTAILHDGTNIIFRKRIGGVNNDAIKALTYTASTVYSLAATYSDANDSEVYINGVQGTGNADNNDIQIGSDFEIGADGNGANQSYSSQRLVKHFDEELSEAEVQGL